MTKSRTETARAASTLDHVGRGEVKQGYQPTLTPENAPLAELNA